MTTNIEWSDETWNPTVGCTRVSEGCRNCYAYTLHDRRHKAWKDGNWPDAPKQYHKPFKEVQLFPNRLDMPLRWRKTRKVFVNSMSDLFHQEVPQYYIDQVFGIMLANYVLERQGDHRFQILTKRPQRMKDYLSASPRSLIQRWSEALDGWVIMDDPDMMFSEYVQGILDKDDLFPLSNVWLGTSVENQKAADERIPHLLQTPAAVRFLSMEPLLGAVDFSPSHLGFDRYSWLDDNPVEFWPSGNKIPKIDWVITGGESGPGARPAHPDWFRSIRDQCQAAGVPFFFKQWGEWVPSDQYPPEMNGVRLSRYKRHTFEQDHQHMFRVGKKAAGRLLDGRTWDEFPRLSSGY